MFVRRCAWHRRYRGHGKLLGVSSWRGWTVTFSDGLCDSCAAQTRAEWGLPPSPMASSTNRRSWMPAFPYATVALAASIAGVVFGLVVAPPKNAGPSRQAATQPATTEVGRPHTPDDAASAAPRAVAHVPRVVPERGLRVEERVTTADVDRRMVGPARTRAKVVRVRDRRPMGVASAGSFVPTSAPLTDAPVGPEMSVMRPGSGAPAVVEFQAP